MADARPSRDLIRQRLIMQLANLRSTIERQRYELMEMNDRRSKNEENIAKSLETIEGYEQTLREFDAAEETE